MSFLLSSLNRVGNVYLGTPLRGQRTFKRLVNRLIRNHRFHIDLGEISQKDYLNVGCGENMYREYINLDFFWHPGIDICWDITKGLPLKDKSIRGIFTEHCLEHITLEANDAVLAEFRRILKPGGTIRIIVPDGELYLTRYTDIVRGTSEAVVPNAEKDVYEGLYSPIMSVNRIFRSHGHRFIYDFDSLRRLLEKHDFTDVRKESFMSGRDSRLLKDTPKRSVESLYVEAVCS